MSLIYRKRKKALKGIRTMDAKGTKTIWNRIPVRIIPTKGRKKANVTVIHYGHETRI